MTQTRQYTLLTVAIIHCALVCALGQTNCTTEFQGFHPGDLVRVKAEKPFLILGNAMFQSQTCSNIVVFSKGDRYVLNKCGVTLSIPEKFSNVAMISARAAENTGQAADPGIDLGKQDAQLLMLGVQQKILGKAGTSKQREEASDFYERTMNGFLGGTVSLGDIVEQAERTLGEVDKYQVERVKDPQFEGQIEYLREFLKRAKGGEKVFGAKALD